MLIIEWPCEGRGGCKMGCPLWTGQVHVALGVDGDLVLERNDSGLIDPFMSQGRCWRRAVLVFDMERATLSKRPQQR